MISLQWLKTLLFPSSKIPRFLTARISGFEKGMIILNLRGRELYARVEGSQKLKPGDVIDLEVVSTKPFRVRIMEKGDGTPGLLDDAAEIRDKLGIPAHDAQEFMQGLMAAIQKESEGPRAPEGKSQFILFGEFEKPRDTRKKFLILPMGKGESRVILLFNIEKRLILPITTREIPGLRAFLAERNAGSFQILPPREIGASSGEWRA